MTTKPTDIDSYLAAVPANARAALEQLRRTVRAAAPDAVESISYGVPTFKYRGRPLVYFAAAKNHCSLYGISVDAYPEQLAGFDASKGTIHFQPESPLPESLVRKLVTDRMAAIDSAAPARKRK